MEDVMRALKFIALVIICILTLPTLAQSREQNGKLLKIVALSRHGVRAPTQDARVLEMWSRKKWPVWPVERGELTPRGAMLITAMWKNLRQKLAAAEILPADQCPAAGSVYVRADVEERTRATARAILNGLGEDCHMGFAVSRDKIDPLFHPVRAGLYQFNPIAAATDVLGMTGGGMEKLQEDLEGGMSLISKINGEPAAKLCARFTLTSNCELTDLPNAVSVSADGSNIRLIGGLSVASSLAEIFLLEYGNWPGESAGWGKVDATTLGQILPVHSRIFDIVNRAPVVAWARGSSLLREMTAALFNSHYDPRCNDAKLAVFVGHDTNLANLGSLLGITWQAAGYPMNGIPPGGVLFLELWENNGQRDVIARFYAQPPKALHAPFSGETRVGAPMSQEEALLHAPVAASVSVLPIVGEARFEAGTFQQLVRRATEGAPIAPQQNPPLEFGRVEPEK